MEKYSNKQQAHTDKCTAAKTVLHHFHLISGSKSAQYDTMSLRISASQKDRQVSVVRFTRQRCSIAQIWVSAHKPCWDY